MDHRLTGVGTPVGRTGKPMVDLFCDLVQQPSPVVLLPSFRPSCSGRGCVLEFVAALDAYAYPPTNLFPKVLAKFVFVSNLS